MVSISNVIVLGGSGDQGIPLISALKRRGLNITIGARRVDAMKSTPFTDMPTVHADITDMNSLTQAFTGHDSLAMHLPFEHDQKKAVSYGENIGKAAQAAGIKKIVFNTSCYVADHDLNISAHDGRRAIKAALSKSGVPTVFIEPVVFMNNLIAPWCKPSIVNHGIFAYPASEELKISMISLNDVAELVVTALVSENITNQSFTVGGPQALTGYDVAEQLSKAAGRDIKFTPLTPDEFAENISELVTGSRTIPAGSVYDGMARFYRFYNDQPTSPLMVDPQSFLKKLPINLTTFETWSNQQNWL